MKPILILALSALILLIGCAKGGEILTDIEPTPVKISKQQGLPQLFVAYEEASNEQENKLLKILKKQTPADKRTKPASHKEKIPTTKQTAPSKTIPAHKKSTLEIPDIPKSKHPSEKLIDIDYTFALVNGEVITTKDIQKDLLNYIDYLRSLKKHYAQSPFDLEGKGSFRRLLDEAQMNAIYRNFERKMLDILYKQKAEEFEKYIGSVPEQAIEEAIQQSKRQHGIFGNDEKSQQKWREILAENNLSHLEFREQIINQLNKQRVLWMIANHPDFRIDITLDITPEELAQAYLKQPVIQVTDIELYRIEIPFLPTNYDAVLKKVSDYRDQLEEAFQTIDKKHKTRRFLKITRAFFPEKKQTLKLAHLKNLEDEQPEVAYEIRLTNKDDLPALCATVELEDRLVIIFLVSKKEKGLAPFASNLVQIELFRRLHNELWNEFRRRYEQKLVREATIIPGDLVSPR